MNRFLNDVRQYGRAVFLEGRQWVLALFDGLGILLFLFPKWSVHLQTSESMARTVAGVIFLMSYTIANFNAYRLKRATTRTRFVGAIETLISDVRRLDPVQSDPTEAVQERAGIIVGALPFSREKYEAELLRVRFNVALTTEVYFMEHVEDRDRAAKENEEEWLEWRDQFLEFLERLLEHAKLISDKDAA